MARKKLEKRNLAEGEVTGHAHKVGVDVYETQDGLREFEGATTITHEEHDVVEISEDEWVSGRVNEFDHLEQRTRRVAD
jgi:hypothetical protein